MRISKHKETQSGFTLIEVLMAMVILGIGIFAVVALQTKNVQFNTGSKKQTEGYTWAMDQVENLYTVPYSDPGNAGDPLRILGDPTVIGDGIIVTRGPYTVEWDVEDNGAAGLGILENSKRVHVSIRWNTREVAQLDLTRVQSSF